MTPAHFLSDPLALGPWLLRELPALAARLRPLPPWGLGLLLVAALAVTFAGTRLRRPLALAAGAGVGWLVGLAAAGALQLPGRHLPAAGAVLLGAAALLVPSLFPFAAGALPGALAGAALGLPGGPLVGAAVGALLLGGVALLLSTQLQAAAAGLLGGALAGVTLLAGARHYPVLDPLRERPVLLAGLVLVLAIAGAAFQLGRRSGGGGGGKVARPTPPAGAEAQHA